MKGYIVLFQLLFAVRLSAAAVLTTHAWNHIDGLLYKTLFKSGSSATPVAEYDAIEMSMTNYGGGFTNETFVYDDGGYTNTSYWLNSTTTGRNWLTLKSTDTFRAGTTYRIQVAARKSVNADPLMNSFNVILGNNAYTNTFTLSATTTSSRCVFFVNADSKLLAGKPLWVTIIPSSTTSVSVIQYRIYGLDIRAMPNVNTSGTYTVNRAYEEVYPAGNGTTVRLPFDFDYRYTNATGRAQWPNTRAKMDRYLLNVERQWLSISNNVADEMKQAMYTENTRFLLDYYNANMFTGIVSTAEFSSDLRFYVTNALSKGFDVEGALLQSLLSKEKFSNYTDLPMSSRIQNLVNFGLAAKALYPNFKLGLLGALPLLVDHQNEYDYTAVYRQVQLALAAQGLTLDLYYLDMPVDFIGGYRAPELEYVYVSQVTKRIFGDTLTDGLVLTSTAGLTNQATWAYNVRTGLGKLLKAGYRPCDMALFSWYTAVTNCLPESTNTSVFGCFLDVDKALSEYRCDPPEDLAIEGFEAPGGGIESPDVFTAATGLAYDSNTLYRTGCGTWSARLVTSRWVQAAVNTIPYNRVRVTFAFKAVFLAPIEEKDGLTLEWSNDGGTNWIPVAVLGELNNRTFLRYQYVLPTGTGHQTNLLIRWRMTGNGAPDPDYGYLDDILIEGLQ